MFDFSLTICPLLALFATDLRPPSSFLARRTTRLASRFGLQFSQSRSCCMSPDSDLDLSRLAQPPADSLLPPSTLSGSALKSSCQASPRLISSTLAPACFLHTASPLIFYSQTDPPAPQASTSSSTPVIPQSSPLHAYRPWILSSAPFISLNLSGVRLQLGYVSFLSPLSRRPARSSAPPTRRSPR
ncbi:hypothetical protein ATANTOWER_031839 [Ataeniobius toweri]|uniref:Uncharacterized protein n=1 Tax=Ataeniobius toweri TaxID=208326 RepID=A0ABU7AAQ9_9TELE|nr:hypothetical protein [Ataeniobius toweri]